MFVSHAEYVGMVTNNIGMLFTEDSVARHNYDDCGYLDQIPQVNEERVIKEEQDWVRVSGFFKPEEEFEYLVIGNMHPNSETTYELVRQFFDDRATLSGTYFVDDVLVRPCLIATPDTLICKGNSVDLKAWGSPIHGWADSQNPDEILERDTIFTVQPDITTTYLVYAECDTLSVTVSIPESLQDTSICEGESIDLFLKYEKDGDEWIGDSLLTLSDQVTYTIERKYPGCIQSETFSILFKPKPALYLGEDSLICSIDTIYLDVTESNATYKWDNNSEDPLRIITQPGLYSVEGWLDGCYNKNSINISLEECSTELLIPNVFTLNNDQMNDSFIPISINGIAKIYCRIFNRYGETLFETQNTDIGWDGTYNRKMVPSGIYYWQIDALDRNGSQYRHKGTVSLIR